jgi:hypothetical protein
VLEQMSEGERNLEILALRKDLCYGGSIELVIWSWQGRKGDEE